MKFKTTNSLIEKQRLYWDEDFYMPGDEISEVFEISTEEIINEDLEVLSSYAKSKEDIAIVNSFLEALENQKPLPPLLIDSKNHLIDGYHRLLAVKKLKIATVPVLKLNRSCR